MVRNPGVGKNDNVRRCFLDLRPYLLEQYWREEFLVDVPRSEVY